MELPAYINIYEHKNVIHLNIIEVFQRDTYSNSSIRKYLVIYRIKFCHVVIEQHLKLVSIVYTGFYNAVVNDGY